MFTKRFRRWKRCRHPLVAWSNRIDWITSTKNNCEQLERWTDILPLVTNCCLHRSHWSVQWHRQWDSMLEVQPPKMRSRWADRWMTVYFLLRQTEHMIDMMFQLMRCLSQCSDCFTDEDFLSMTRWMRSSTNPEDNFTSGCNGASLAFNVSTSYWLPWKRNVWDTAWDLSSVT